MGYIFSNQLENLPRIFQMLQGIAEYPAIRIFSLFPEILRGILDVSTILSSQCVLASSAYVDSISMPN